MRQNAIIIIVLFSACLQKVQAQKLDSAYTLNIIASYFEKEQKVSLRWVPSTPGFWSLCNYYGYTLQRTELDTTQTAPLEWKILGNIKPIPLDEWKVRVTNFPTDTMLMVAGQAIHGERMKQNFDLSSMIKQSDQLQNYYSACILAAEFSKEAALAAALRFEDKTIVKDKNYMYKITVNLSDTLSFNPFAGVVVNTFEEEKYPEITLSEIKEGEKLIELFWDRNYYKNYYSAYNIFGSNDGKTFKKLNFKPVSYITYGDDTKYTYRDSLKENYLVKYYKIEGITAFGNTGPSSAIFNAQGRDRTRPDAPFDVQTQSLGNGKMKITWRVNASDTDIAGFRISRSNEIDKGFVEITPKPLSPEKRSFIDTSANELLNNYYFIGVFDKENNVNVSMPKYGTIIDSVPPSSPFGLTGNIDTNGIVTVRWRLGTEQDLKGYFIHYSDKAGHTFINRTDHPLQDTVWRDTIPLNVLTEDIYYKIVAIDHRYNYSDYSTVLKLTKPDLIHPVSPIFINSKVLENGIELQWYNSSSHDVVKNVLARKKKGEVNFTDIKEIAPHHGKTKFVDDKIEPGTDYVYQLYAVDDAGLISEKISSINVRSFINKNLDAVTKFEIFIDTVHRTYVLRWLYKDYKNHDFIIYRSINDGPFVNYKNVSGALSFEEKYIRKNDKCKFKIRPKNQKGWLGEFSEELILLFHIKN